MQLLLVSSSLFPCSSHRRRYRPWGLRTTEVSDGGFFSPYLQEIGISLGGLGDANSRFLQCETLSKRRKMADTLFTCIAERGTERGRKGTAVANFSRSETKNKSAHVLPSANITVLFVPYLVGSGRLCRSPARIWLKCTAAKSTSVGSYACHLSEEVGYCVIVSTRTPTAPSECRRRRMDDTFRGSCTSSSSASFGRVAGLEQPG